MSRSLTNIYGQTKFWFQFIWSTTCSFRKHFSKLHLWLSLRYIDCAVWVRRRSKSNFKSATIIKRQERQFQVFENILFTLISSLHFTFKFQIRHFQMHFFMCKRWNFDETDLELVYKPPPTARTWIDFLFIEVFPVQFSNFNFSSKPYCSITRLEKIVRESESNYKQIEWNINAKNTPIQTNHAKKGNVDFIYWTFITWSKFKLQLLNFLQYKHVDSNFN